MPSEALRRLKDLTIAYDLSIAAGHFLFLNNNWYVTHAGLLYIAAQRRCHGMHVTPEIAFSNPTISQWAFKATIYWSAKCRGFVGYGDADPSNVSSVVRGAEMRVAETRAVNRAIRKAYGIGICSVEDQIPAQSRRAQPRTKEASSSVHKRERERQPTPPRPALPAHP